MKVVKMKLRQQLWLVWFFITFALTGGETLSRKLDLTLDPVTSQRRDRNRIRELLQMTSCEKIRDSSKQANVIRDALADKLFMEKQTGMVC